MTAVRELLAQLDGFEVGRFPVEHCTQPSDEPRVREAQVSYVVLVEGRARGDGYVLVVRPYVYDGPEGVCYGWVDSHGNVWAHHEQSCHDLDEDVVIAWRRRQDDDE